ncbi:Iron-sulfur cluster regulator IscR [Lachnospiraceae bacterium TWA4]|nr:Iron-sulfur cluster regulator IscR [Lachnospiraceae bacterium TWA4]
MKITTKGRYALRVMIDLAQHEGEGFISLKAIADRQGISMKYLESIVSLLNKSGLLLSQRGKDGGYQLKNPVEEYTIGQILKLSEGSLTPVACLDYGTHNCEKSADCITLPMWQKLDAVIEDYLDSVTLRNLIERNV